MSVVTKPWGYYEDYFRTDDVVFKKIVITPGQSISYQIHHRREEFWYIVSGKGIMKIDGTLWRVEPKQYYHIKKNSSHQNINDGTEDVVAYEMQFGFCSEDDLMRIEDQYGRS